MIRRVDPGEDAVIALIARRMRLTLMEVIGPEEGERMHTMEWLVDRVRFHLDPARSTAAVFVAHAEPRTPGELGPIAGHTIVRIQQEDAGVVGLFSTTYVAHEHRRQGFAHALLTTGEGWITEHGMHPAATWTAADNAKLIALYEAHGYAITTRDPPMVRLERRVGCAKGVT